jgi:hypothetical protein
LTARSHLPITFDQANQVKADTKMVKTDRKAWRVVRTDRKLRVPAESGCYA